jgi:hypothetical protein
MGMGGTVRDEEEDREGMIQEVEVEGKDGGTPHVEEGGDRLANLQERAHRRHLVE